MDAFEKLLRSKLNHTIGAKPVFFNFNRAADRTQVKRLLQRGEVLKVVDDYREQLQELFAAKHPQLVYTPGYKKLFSKYIEKLERQRPLYEQGAWVYFSWLRTLVHILHEPDFHLVRTMRNQELITQKEQKQFYNAVVGIGGLSVGNSVALAITLQGGAKHFRLADPDQLSLSNTNRVRSGVEYLGMSKVEMTARQIYALNPYAVIELFPEGLTEKNIQKFFIGQPRLSIMIDELDNLAIKYLVRKMAKRYRVAIVMGADNGDNAVVDIERYDKNPQPSFFHKRMGAVTYDELRSLTKFGIGKYITKHIGPENVTPRMLQSLQAMGKTIVSWPQLGGAALLNGSAVAYSARKIITGGRLESNRALLSLDEKLIPGYNSKGERAKRRANARAFKKLFGL